MQLEFRARNELRLNPEDHSASRSSPSAAGQSSQPARLRLCFISNPNSIHTRRWVGWFARRGHTVCLLADVPPREPWAEAPVIDLSRYFRAPIIRFPVWEVWLRRFIRRWHPDVLHAHRVNSAGWLAATSGFHPFVLTPWGSDVLVGTQRSKVAHLLARYTLQHADKVTVISQVISERSLELGAQKDKLIRIYNGVDFNIFFPRTVSKQENLEFRHNLSLPETTHLVFSPRAIHPIYNQDIILQAIPRVCEKIPEVCFIFSDFNTQPEYKQQLDGMTRDLGVKESLRWLPATSSPMEMADRYRFSDVMVSVPSSDGGTPLTVMEAMACGKPVICSDLPAAREFLANGENGWLIPVRQPAPLAEAIIHALKNPEQAAEFGRKAWQIVAERANLDKEMQRMEAIYYQLAGTTKD
jgi:glycosyltransferase involved in cell wall biosynthesis